MRPQQSFVRRYSTPACHATARLLVGFLAWLVLTCGTVPTVARAAEPEPVHFSRDILPILSENCFACHGPDAKARKGELRLDLKETALRIIESAIVPSKSGEKVFIEAALRKTEAVIVPGKSGESELIYRVASKDVDEVMPPPKSGKKLTAHQIDLLKRWIDQGPPGPQTRSIGSFWPGSSPRALLPRRKPSGPR
jgi:hypothetical protein